MNSLRSRFLGWIKVVYSPVHAFSHCASGPTYLIPLLFLSLLSVFLNFAQFPIQLHWTQFQLSAAGNTPDQIAGTLHFLERTKLFSLILVPLFLLFRWIIFSLLIWLTTQLVLDSLEFRQTLNIVSYAYFPMVLRDAFSCLILGLRSNEALLSPDGLKVAVGLDLFFPHIPLPWSSLAGNLNIFEFWYAALLVIGISRVVRCNRQKSLAVVLPCWFLASLLKLALVSLNYSFQNSLAIL